ncbi:MAG TPA: hypothetical protein VER97_12190 [Geodermatophilus sp.]|nr:hypothetical protein [Geodermatophilus sp.]
MHFMAIVEHRLPQRYVYIPVLATGGPVPEPSDDVEACPAALVAAATGLFPADVQVSLSHVAWSNTLLPVPPTEVDVRHRGVWQVAQHTGWLRQRDGSWWPLVTYEADGAVWTRAVRATHVRRLGAGVAAVPAPRAGSIRATPCPVMALDGQLADWRPALGRGQRLAQVIAPREPSGPTLIEHTDRSSRA